ncbi:MAG: TerC family protein [Verrucomicrobiota bacterium]|nr:TerC family protein [Verrucomicrobiota bacterium]
MEWLSDPQAWIGLLTLTALEIVLGIDNVIFISILADKLPAAKQKQARQIGLGLAMIMRILLLLSLSWIIGLTKPFFVLAGFDVTGRALILLVGGLFLIAKSTHEIHDTLEGDEEGGPVRSKPSLRSVLIQIILLDMVFSLDSVITAVGMVDQIGVMIVAVMLAVGVMMTFAGAISGFVERHPTIKMLGLSFLLLIGVNLIGESLGFHIPKGYTYFAMGFAVFVEVLNLKLRKQSAAPVKLHHPKRSRL